MCARPVFVRRWRSKAKLRPYNVERSRAFLSRQDRRTGAGNLPLLGALVA